MAGGRSPRREALALLSCAALCGAAPTAANPTDCTQGGAERSIEVVYSRPGAAVPCEVVYRKPAAAVTDVLWRADHQAGYCEARAQELAETLRAAGWQCTARAAAVDMNDALLEPDMLAPVRVEVD